jgi:hypothetical protein
MVILNFTRREAVSYQTTNSLGKTCLALSGYRCTARYCAGFCANQARPANPLGVFGQMIRRQMRIPQHHVQIRPPA